MSNGVHNCTGLECPRPLHRCLNPLCDHLVYLAFVHCCEACRSAGSRGRALHPADTPGVHYSDCHSRACDKLHLARGPAPARHECIRCGASPAGYQASDTCFDCDPGTLLCGSCYVVHATEVVAAAWDDAGMATTFRYPTLDGEKIWLARSIIERPGRFLP